MLKLELLILPFVPLLLMGVIAAVRHARQLSLLQGQTPRPMAHAQAVRRGHPR